MIKINTLKGHTFFVGKQNVVIEVIPEGKLENGKTIPSVTFIKFMQSKVRIEKFELGMSEVNQVEDLPMWVIEGFDDEEAYLAKKEEDDKKNREILDAKKDQELKEFNKKLEKKAKKLAEKEKAKKKKSKK